MDTFIILGIFIAVLFVIEMLYYAYATVRNPDVEKVRKRLKSIPVVSDSADQVDIVRRRPLSDVPWLDRLLSTMPGVKQLDQHIVQANLSQRVGVFILLSLVLAICGFYFSLPSTRSTPISIVIGLFFGYCPVLFIKLKKSQRMRKFQRQLPDALDLVARSLKAGHAFSSSMKMVSDEFDDPIGTEFSRTLDEINFGVTVTDSLKNLAGRVDCPDLTFFIVSVIIQRDTGGNLAEIIENIANLIRERFKLLGHISALAAEGKVSAYVLIGLPFLLALVLSFLNPGYLATMGSDPIGKALIGFAATLMIIGIVVMRRMIEIKV